MCDFLGIEATDFDVAPLENMTPILSAKPNWRYPVALGPLHFIIKGELNEKNIDELFCYACGVEARGEYVGDTTARNCFIACQMHLSHDDTGRMLIYFSTLFI